MLLENNYIESKLLEGFWSDISGVIEHTELLTYITNYAREKQHKAIIIILDLQNAFSEVDHGLLLKVLDYYCIKYARIRVFIDSYLQFCPYRGEYGSVKTRILAYFM